MPPLPSDGKDIRSLMFGEAGAESPHDYFYCYYGNDELQAIRTGTLETSFSSSLCVVERASRRRDGMPVPYEQLTIGEVLYDLDNDASESHDVAAEHPDIVAKLKAAADVARADLGDT